jgi:Dehydrogenases with different specificities (related to short-chain alcohol dehydrogenases)
VKVGSKTKQGIKVHMGVNVVAPFLFTQLLLPKLQAAAVASPKNNVRIIWTSSCLMEQQSPKGGYNLEDIEKSGTNNAYINYATSKAANWMVADEAGIMSVVQNPGNLKTHIYNT